MTTQEVSIPIVRVPITGIIRVPIVGIERVPIIGVESETLEELQWDDVYSSLVNYIKFASKQVSGQCQNSVVNSAEDLFQEGQLLLYHCFTIYKHKPFNEFAALFKASLWRKLREISGKKTFIQVDLEDAYDLGYSDDIVEDLYNEYKLQQVASMLENCPVALTIFKEFVNPSSRTLWEAEMDVARKMTLKEQEYSVAVPKTIQIKGIHIQRALEIPKVKFNEYFAMVKNCVSSVYRQSEDLDEPVEELLETCS